MVQAVEHLSGKHESLSLNPNTTKKIPKKSHVGIKIIVFVTSLKRVSRLFQGYTLNNG
jgi:hypothetical protein